jgi:hypothetical protein
MFEVPLGYEYHRFEEEKERLGMVSLSQSRQMPG